MSPTAGRTMTAQESSGGAGSFRTVLIGGREYPKPFDHTCPVCRSPWLISIDEMLAEGYSYSAIRKMLAGRRPASPREHHIAAHLPHLAEPHRKMRADVEASAAGEEPLSLAGLPEVTRAVISRGFQELAAGRLEVTSRDLVAALRLQAQLDRSDAGGLDANAWQSAFLEFFALVRKHMNAAQWQAFTAEVYDSPAIRSVLAGSSPALPQGAPS